MNVEDLVVESETLWRPSLDRVKSSEYEYGELQAPAEFPHNSFQRCSSSVRHILRQAISSLIIVIVMHVAKIGCASSRGHLSAKFGLIEGHETEADRPARQSLYEYYFTLDGRLPAKCET